MYYAYELYSSPIFFGNISWSAGSDDALKNDEVGVVLNPEQNASVRFSYVQTR